MKRCPKCNRTFPDENQKFCTVDGGLLIAAPPAFDPNATIRATSADLGMHSSEKATSRELPDPSGFNTAASAPTEMFPRNTARTGIPTSADLPVSPPPATPPPPPSQAATVIAPAPPMAEAPSAPAKKKSKLPYILTALVLLLLIGVGGAVGLFFFVIKPRLGEFGERTVVNTPTPLEETNSNSAANTNAATPEPTPEEDTFVPPANAVKFENSRASLDGKLDEHYFDFSFYYPQSWLKDPKAGVSGATNFAKVERRLPPDFTQENFAVGWYTSKGTYEADKDSFPQLAEKLSESFSSGFPKYRKISEGQTKINSLNGYEFRFSALSEGTEKGDIQIWGRVVFLPSGNEGDSTGATIVMLATSLAPELSGVADVGEKGEMPVILESFRFGKK
jgi:hypothetical protein